MTKELQMPLAEQRYAKILNELSRRGSLRTRELATKLNISEMTIRRDLNELERRSLLKRIHGGATLNLAAKDLYDSRDLESVNIKDSIAQQVIKKLEERALEKPTPQVVYLDSGTTSMAVVRQLCENTTLPPMTLVMHGVNIAYHLVNQTYHRLHLVGGEIYQNTYSTFGNDALNVVSQFNFDLFLLGASGFNEHYFSNTNYVEISMKKAVIARSKEIWMMLDSSKWQQSHFAQICDYSQLNKLFLGPLKHPRETLIKQKYPHLEMIHCY